MYRVARAARRAGHCRPAPGAARGWLRVAGARLFALFEHQLILTRTQLTAAHVLLSSHQYIFTLAMLWSLQYVFVIRIVKLIFLD